MLPQLTILATDALRLLTMYRDSRGDTDHTDVITMCTAMLSLASHNIAKADGDPFRYLVKRYCQTVTVWAIQRNMHGQVLSPRSQAAVAVCLEKAQELDTKVPDICGQLIHALRSYQATP